MARFAVAFFIDDVLIENIVALEPTSHVFSVHRLNLYIAVPHLHEKLIAKNLQLTKIDLFQLAFFHLKVAF